MTKLPQPGPRKTGQTGAPPTVAIAVFVGLVLSAAFIGLAAVVIPGVLLMALAGLGMCLFFILQYFLWAKWLYPIVMKMEKDAALDDAALDDATLSGRMPGTSSETDQ